MVFKTSCFSSKHTRDKRFFILLSNIRNVNRNWLYYFRTANRVISQKANYSRYCCFLLIVERENPENYSAICEAFLFCNQQLKRTRSKDLWHLQKAYSEAIVMSEKAIEIFIVYTSMHMIQLRQSSAPHGRIKKKNIKWLAFKEYNPDNFRPHSPFIKGFSFYKRVVLISHNGLDWSTISLMTH